MAAVIEAAMQGIPAIGFSLLDYSPEADFEPSADIIRKITREALNQGIPLHHCLNVNIPKTDNIRGIKLCRQAKGKWIEDFDVRQDPHKRTYMWLTGYYEITDEGKDTDEYALSNDYVSVVPVQYDLTDYAYLEELKKWKLDE
jgi:5'-nucleotidase